jgi:hypothetical protein
MTAGKRGAPLVRANEFGDNLPAEPGGELAGELRVSPQGHSFQYPLEGYKSRTSRQAAQLGFILALFR